MSEITFFTSMLERLRKFFKGEKYVAALLDGPNILRKVEGRRVSLNDLRKKIDEYGVLKKAVAVVSSDAPPSLIKALNLIGFEVHAIDAKSDPYIWLAVFASRVLFSEIPYDVLFVISRDTRCLPIVQKGKEKGLKVVVAGFEPGFSTALKHAADEIVYLKLEEVK